MAKSSPSKNPLDEISLNEGGDNHQHATGAALTTNQGLAISDDQNSLKSGLRGPTLLEDFHLREKITHFDHERIPERIVHARGSGAHGYFECTHPIPELTKASFLSEIGKRTEVFARLSTVAGGAGSIDLPRDVRGFSVKFYTDEGNYDFVGNNIPVFFIQDAIKFPDLIHSVKMEPDRGFPQAASAHDTFWDFVSLMPESMNMLLWLMSDRAIPRSLRMMEGFGVHTFKLVNAKGVSTFVKFHWRPKLGAVSVLWDEAIKISGADQDFHRRDLFEAIAKGDFPEWEFGVQAFTQEQADGFDFDILDATKIIPEEHIPIQIVGRMVLDRNPTNFFAETEQVAFHPGHLVPGIDFTNDPLLQGRLFSYTDTQLSRLGGPNFHEIPINRPRCPMHNLQRDGIHRMDVDAGRVAYEPNSLDPKGPRESPATGFATDPGLKDNEETGTKIRQRSATFADHYSQARQFFQSMTLPEQNHIVEAFSFELSKVDTVAIRQRMLGHLHIVDETLATQVEGKLGMTGEAVTIKPLRKPIELEPSPSLSLIAKAKPTLQGRKVGVLMSDGIEEKLVGQLRAAVEGEGATLALVAARIKGVKSDSGKMIPADFALAAAPSVLFDALVLLSTATGNASLLAEPATETWIKDGFNHLKFIGYVKESLPLFEMLSLDVRGDKGCTALDSAAAIKRFTDSAKKHRFWDRDPKNRPS